MVTLKISFLNDTSTELQISDNEALHRLFTDDFGAPPYGITIERTEKGETESIYIPYKR